MRYVKLMLEGLLKDTGEVDSLFGGEIVQPLRYGEGLLHCPVLYGIAYQRHPHIDKHNGFIAISPDLPNWSRGWDLVGIALHSIQVQPQCLSGVLQGFLGGVSARQTSRQVGESDGYAVCRIVEDSWVDVSV